MEGEEDSTVDESVFISNNSEENVAFIDSTVRDMQETIKDMSEVIENCSQLETSGDENLRFVNTPKMILSSQVNHMQHLLDTVKRKGSLRVQLLEKGLNRIIRDSLDRSELIARNSQSMETTSNNNNEEINRSLDKEQEPSYLISFNNFSESSDISSLNFSGFSENNIATLESDLQTGLVAEDNISETVEINREEEILVSNLIDFDSYPVLDRPHTRQRGRAVPVQHIMDQPLEYNHKKSEGR